MTREEFEALLEEAFIEGYNDANLDIIQEKNLSKMNGLDVASRFVVPIAKGINRIRYSDPEERKWHNKKIIAAVASIKAARRVDDAKDKAYRGTTGNKINDYRDIKKELERKNNYWKNMSRSEDRADDKIAEINARKKAKDTAKRTADRVLRPQPAY